MDVMSRAAILRQFEPGQRWRVTNHYISRADHPCYGTRERTIERISASHLYFTETGSVPLPRAAHIEHEPGIVRFYWDHAGKKRDLLLTLEAQS